MELVDTNAADYNVREYAQGLARWSGATGFGVRHMGRGHWRRDRRRDDCRWSDHADCGDRLIFGDGDLERSRWWCDGRSDRIANEQHRCGIVGVRAVDAFDRYSRLDLKCYGNVHDRLPDFIGVVD
jgi:hypothetical protein